MDKATAIIVVYYCLCLLTSSFGKFMNNFIMQSRKVISLYNPPVIFEDFFKIGIVRLVFQSEGALPRKLKHHQK